MSAAEFAERLHARPTSKGWEARCPAHDDRNASLSISEGDDGRTLLHCHAGCDFNAIVAAAGLKPADLFSPKAKTPRASRTPSRTFPTPEAAARACTPHGATLEAIFDYPRNGKPFAAVGRYRVPGDKSFRQFHHDGTAWTAGGPSGKWPLYREDALPTTGPVEVFEGEKKTEAAAAVGLSAVASSGGASAALKTDWTPLAGREVFIWPDADEAGGKYATTVAGVLAKLTPPASVKIVRLPFEMGSGLDVADYLAAGHGVEELNALARAATEWQPTAAQSPNGDAIVPLDPIAAARSGSPYAMTDLGNAERLVAYHGDEIRWDAARKVWRVWDGRRWAVDDALEVNRRAADTARRIRQEAAAAPASNCNGRDLGRDLFSHAVKSESRDRLAAMQEVAKARPGIAISAVALDSDPWVLNVLNGTLDLLTGTLRPHNRADLLTKLTPIEYRPDCRSERWERFLADATGNDPELIAFLQTVAGYTLTGDTSEEKLFLVHGPEASGKTTFLEALRATMGEYARTIQADLLTKQRDSRGGGAASPELAGLAGARLAAGSEMEQGREIAEALAKNLTGGEPITARHLYAELFDFRPQFKLWLALNHCPKVSADDGAIWRRILRIGFEHTVPLERRDKTLKPYLRAPAGGAPAVLAWAVEGCLRWQREGLIIPAAVARSTSAYRAESDPLATFSEDCLRFTHAAWTPWGEIWAAYNEHAADNGTPERYRVTPKRLQERLRAHGCTSERRRTGRGWCGVEVQEGWKTGERDARDGCDATLQKSFCGSPPVEVLNIPAHPSHPSHNAASELDPVELEERIAIMEEVRI